MPFALGEKDQAANIRAWFDWLLLDDDEGLDNLVLLLLHCQQVSGEPDSGYKTHTDTTQDRILNRELTPIMLYPTKVPDEYYRVGLVRSRGEAAYNLMITLFEVERDEKVCTMI